MKRSLPPERIASIHVRVVRCIARVVMAAALAEIDARRWTDASRAQECHPGQPNA